MITEPYVPTKAGHLRTGYLYRFMYAAQTKWSAWIVAQPMPAIADLLSVEARRSITIELDTTTRFERKVQWIRDPNA